MGDGHLGEFSLPNKERRLASMKWMEKEGWLMLIGPAQGRRFIHHYTPSVFGFFQHFN